MLDSLAHHRAGEHLVHARDRNDLEPTLDAVRDFDKILRVLFGNEDCFDACVCRKLRPFDLAMESHNVTPE